MQFPCPTCGQKHGVRKDKNGKPYLVCDPCGVQMFVRGKQGIENLHQLIEILRQHDLPFREHARVLHEIQAMVTEIRGLEKELEKLDGFEFFASDRRNKDKARVRKSLNERIESLLSQLDEIASADAHS